VLYIEDNDDNVYMLKMRLELLGDFEVLAAEDGQKGCEMAATEQPDIILMDVEMPVIDGCHAATEGQSANLATSRSSASFCQPTRSRRRATCHGPLERWPLRLSHAACRSGSAQRPTKRLPS
jgi:response regulator RpfG family c-di-GMP phosphodiesterase